jgi:hypothetical protein
VVGGGDHPLANETWVLGYRTKRKSSVTGGRANIMQARQRYHAEEEEEEEEERARGFVRRPEKRLGSHHPDFGSPLKSRG